MIQNLPATIPWDVKGGSNLCEGIVHSAYCNGVWQTASVFVEQRAFWVINQCNNIQVDLTVKEYVHLGSTKQLCWEVLREEWVPKALWPFRRVATAPFLSLLLPQVEERVSNTPTTGYT